MGDTMTTKPRKFDYTGRRLATQNWLRAQGRDALAMLTPREILILQLRYGLLDGEIRTFEEVGRKMGFTRERVRQIEVKAFTRLRHKEAMRRLEEEDDATSKLAG